MPILPAEEWQMFETIYLESLKAKNFTVTKLWVKMNENTSASASILAFDWDTGIIGYSVGRSDHILFNILELLCALIK